MLRRLSKVAVAKTRIIQGRHLDITGLSRDEHHFEWLHPSVDTRDSRGEVIYRKSRAPILKCSAENGAFPTAVEGGVNRGQNSPGTLFNVSSNCHS
jgi:hypothetical protein